MVFGIFDVDSRPPAHVSRSLAALTLFLLLKGDQYILGVEQPLTGVIDRPPLVPQYNSIPSMTVYAQKPGSDKWQYDYEIPDYGQGEVSQSPCANNDSLSSEGIELRLDNALIDNNFKEALMIEFQRASSRQDAKNLIRYIEKKANNEREHIPVTFDLFLDSLDMLLGEQLHFGLNNEVLDQARSSLSSFWRFAEVKTLAAAAEDEIYHDILEQAKADNPDYFDDPERLVKKPDDPVLTFFPEDMEGYDRRHALKKLEIDGEFDLSKYHSLFKDFQEFQAKIAPIYIELEEILTKKRGYSGPEEDCTP